MATVPISYDDEEKQHLMALSEVFETTDENAVKSFIQYLNKQGKRTPLATVANERMPSEKQVLALKRNLKSLKFNQKYRIMGKGNLEDRMASKPCVPVDLGVPYVLEDRVEMIVICNRLKASIYHCSQLKGLHVKNLQEARQELQTASQKFKTARVEDRLQLLAAHEQFKADRAKDGIELQAALKQFKTDRAEDGIKLQAALKQVEADRAKDGIKLQAALKQVEADRVKDGIKLQAALKQVEADRVKDRRQSQGALGQSKEDDLRGEIAKPFKIAQDSDRAMIQLLKNKLEGMTAHLKLEEHQRHSSVWKRNLNSYQHALQMIMAGPLDIIEVANHDHAIQVFLCSAYMEQQLKIYMTDLNFFIKADNDTITSIYDIEGGLSNLLTHLKTLWVDGFWNRKVELLVKKIGPDWNAVHDFLAKEDIPLTFHDVSLEKADINNYVRCRNSAAHELGFPEDLKFYQFTNFHRHIMSLLPLAMKLAHLIANAVKTQP